MKSINKAGPKKRGRWLSGWVPSSAPVAQESEKGEEAQEEAER